MNIASSNMKITKIENRKVAAFDIILFIFY